MTRCVPHASRSAQITIRLDTDFFEVRDKLPEHGLLVFTGPIDAYYAR
jgi:UDP-galactopyranose mutase